jgi:hypothetical protein
VSSDERPLVVVDGANVVGSVPDGWWRDREAAIRRLREALGPVAVAGIGDEVEPPVDVTLVVEGAARGVESTPNVRVVSAAGAADDTIVDLVAQADPRRRRVVVTADRELRERVEALGAEVVGPRAVYPPPHPPPS